MMFTNERYLTREVADRVPIDIQLLMWDLVQQIEEKDYLQVFELTPKGSGVVEMIHKQEIPESTMIHKIKHNEIKYGCKKLFGISLEAKKMLMLDVYKELQNR